MTFDEKHKLECIDKSCKCLWTPQQIANFDPELDVLLRRQTADEDLREFYHVR